MPRRKGRTAAMKKIVRRRRRFGHVGRGAGLAMSGAVKSLQDYRAQLAAQCNEWAAQIQAVDGALQVMGVAVPARSVGRKPVGRPAGRRGPRNGGRRGPRAGSLKEYILKVISGGRTMSVKEITAGVLAAGYPTKNQTLAKSVGIALTELPGVKKIARGKFRRT